MSTMKRFFQDESGATAIEYGLIAALIAVVIIGAVTAALVVLGSGLVIAPNQDFVLGSVPQRDAGTAGGTLITAQRIGAAIGIVVIGTALFGSGSSGGGGQGTSGPPQPQLLHTAPAALLAAVGFVLAALICGLFMPRRLGDERAEENT